MVCFPLTTYTTTDGLYIVYFQLRFRGGIFYSLFASLYARPLWDPLIELSVFVPRIPSFAHTKYILTGIALNTMLIMMQCSLTRYFSSFSER